MITLEANYSKKIGLPGYSSHQYSVSLKTELADVTQVQTESARLYAVLQQAWTTTSSRSDSSPMETEMATATDIATVTQTAMAIVTATHRWLKPTVGTVRTSRRN